VTAGSAPCTQFDHSAACSVPGAPGKSTTFACTADASQLPDGPVTVCARSADASVPDNPASATQTGTATQANLSDAQCDTVTLDRSVPAPDPGTPDLGSPDPGTPNPGTPDPVTPNPGVTPGAGLQIGSLNILVPKRFRIGKVRQLVVATNASRAGRLTLSLTRGKKVYSRMSVGLSAGKTKQRLRLPRRMAAGTYTVKIAFRASGAGWAATGTTKVSARS
jgi:hypothetical protein